MQILIFESKSLIRFTVYYFAYVISGISVVIIAIMTIDDDDDCYYIIIIIILLIIKIILMYILVIFIIPFIPRITLACIISTFIA